MDRELARMKQELSQEISWLLSNLPKIKKQGKKEDLEYNFEQFVSKMTRLYYLHLYQIDKITALTVDEKEKIKKNILKDYQASIAKLLVVFNYGSGK